MSDFLLVHGAWEGPWAWGRVWGLLTTPPETPPLLFEERAIEKAFAVDLPDRACTGVDPCADFLARTVRDYGMRRVILAGKDVTALALLRAAEALKEQVEVRRVVLFAGVLPAQGRKPEAYLSRAVRFLVSPRLPFNRRNGHVKLPARAINRFLCNCLDSFDRTMFVGRFRPIPTALLTARAGVDYASLSVPVTYVVLTQDRLVPPDTQAEMARQLPGAEVLALDSCHEAPLARPREVAEILVRYL